jgi:hypothetical protein
MLALTAMSGALAEDQRNVNVVNATGYGIKFLGFNNPGDNDWSDNELGSVLRNGQSVYVKFNTADQGCVWNFKIEWSDPGYSRRAMARRRPVQDQRPEAALQSSQRHDLVLGGMIAGGGRGRPQSYAIAARTLTIASPLHSRCG